jgi:outer membrane receptor protein involved in Fe transport
MKTTVFLVCAVLCAYAAPVAAQGAGELRGRVTDPSGLGVPGATVSAANPATGAARSTTTDDRGAFTLAGLAPGTYRVRAELGGFSPGERADVRVVSGKPVELTLALAFLPYGETVVVTGSRKEEMVRYTPAAIAVQQADEIQIKPVQNYADLLRSTPGANILQFSARDVQFTARGAVSQASNKTLALVDGRPAYQPYFGMIIWDLLGVDFDEIKQVEVMRGPGSAMWGTNALTGVVNIITKPPAEDVGTHVRVGGGDLGTADVAVRHSGLRGRLGYKFGGSFYRQDAWERPSTLPDGTPMPVFENQGTKRGAVAGRVDFAQSANAKWRFDGSFAQTEGGIVTVVGPQRATPARHGFGRAQYERGATRVGVSIDAHHLFVESLLSPTTVDFKYKTVQAEAEHKFVIPKQVLTLAGTARFNHFDISVVPDEHTRQETGLIADTEVFVTDQVRLRAGGRLDWFSSFGVTFSPRVGVVVEPVKGHTLRASYNRAYVAPSFLENYFVFPTATVIPLPTGPFTLPFLTQGNPDLDPLTDQAVEVGYTGVFGPRATVTISAYRNRMKGIITLVPTELYTPASPPPGWPLPVEVLAALSLPKTLTELNLGTVVDAGVELAVDARLSRALSSYANYSFQKTPDVSQDIPILLNTPARHRFNAGISGTRGHLFGSLSVSATSRAFWADVQPFSGWTDGFTLVNLTAGYRFTMRRGDAAIALKALNVADSDVRQHIFGDILRRRLSVELRINY